MNKNDLLFKGVRISVIGCIMVLSLYILAKLCTLYLGDSISTNFSSILNDSFTKLANSIYCSSSTTVDYTLGTTTENKDSLLLSSLYSPFVQYVQASNQAQDSSISTADNTVVIYNSEVSASEANASSSPDPSTQEDSALSPDNTAVAMGNGIYSEIYFEDQDEADSASAVADHVLTGTAYERLQSNQLMIETLKEKLDRKYLVENFYTIGEKTGIDKNIFNVKELLQKDLTITKNPDEPQILICHTHAYEWFADSKDGVASDTIEGVGDELTRLLEAKGYSVIHVAHQYKSKTAYSQALPDLQEILKKYPSIEVILDIHRDGVNSKNKTHTTVTVDGVEMAKIMFFNGVSYSSSSGARSGLYNKNLQTNIAFSLQMKLFAMQQFPELTKKTMLKSYRYNMHLVGRYSLIEVGDNNNTVAEAKAAMKPLSEIIDNTLSTKNEYNK